MKNRPYALYELPQIDDLKDMILQKKKANPDKIAFSFSKSKNIISKTYADVYEDVCLLGTWLYSKNFHRKHIAIIGENSYEWLVAFFAITCSGNVAVPIDRELPENEIARLLDKADVEVIFYSKSYREQIANAASSLKKDVTAYCMSDMQEYIDIGKEELRLGENSFLEYKIDRKQLCCIMFTSGTSGSSKGVMLSHENIAEDINAGCQMFALSGSTLVVLPFHHAFGLVVGVFVPFNYNYNIYINKSLKTFSKDMISVKPQAIAIVPLFIENLYKQIWINAKKENKDKQLKLLIKVSDLLQMVGIDIRRKIFNSIQKILGGNLQFIVCGGASLEIKYIRFFRSLGIEILNGYGTTECSPCIAVNRNFYHKDGTAGIIYPNIDVKISASGEVLVKGPIVMQGYYKDDRATKEVLNDGWYKTGDLGYLDDEGFLTLTGRCKNLIILSNGENVSPEELEANFLKYDEVQEVLVYEENGIIIAEIFPDEEYRKRIGDENLQEYFDKICKEINSKRPLYKKVGKVKLRYSEFEKNTSKKILRYNRKEDAK